MLKGGGALVVSFSLAGRTWATGAGRGSGKTVSARPRSIPSSPSTAKAPSRVYSGKVDLGTGVRTALAQMAAEELDVPFARVKVVARRHGANARPGPTWGSLSIQIGGMQIRRPRPRAKAALLDEAAKRLGVKQEDLKVADGVISRRRRSVPATAS